MADQAEAGPSTEYQIPRPGKINLKKTKTERAQKVYDREARREKHRRRLISRANGYAVSPPRTFSRDESITPPRFQSASASASASKGKSKATEPIHILDGSDEDNEIQEMGYRWMGDLGRSAKRMRVEEERMQHLEQEDLLSREGDPFTSYSTSSFAYSSYVETATSTSIPARHRHNTSHLRREESYLRGVPDIGCMTDSEYAAYIRSGFDKDRRETERVEEVNRAAERARIALEKEKERLKEEKKERKKEKERQRAFHHRQQGRTAGPARSGSDTDTNTGAEDGIYVTNNQDYNAFKRKRYISRWANLNERADATGTGTGAEGAGAGEKGEIQEIEMRYSDIPWPTYSASLEKDDINAFLSDMSSADGDRDKGKMRKTLRETIRIFHPDKFLGRFLARVREGDREKVKEGVERVSRAINDLMAEQSGR